MSVMKKIIEEMRKKEVSGQVKPEEIPTLKELDSRFFDPKLLQYIKEELDKDHLLDNKEKMAVFGVALTAELPDPRDHVSCALKGESSAGKDNCIKTVLLHFPEKDSFFLTRATNATLEDEIHSIKRVAFSEMNNEKDKGANKDLREIIKQMSEGGLSFMKKDPATGFKMTIKGKVPQKSVLYGTTEVTDDPELETRFVVIPIRGNPPKNKICVDDTLDKSANCEYYINKVQKPVSWIAEGISQLDSHLQPIIPFAPIFKNPIQDTDGSSRHLFDYAKERIKRDAKRLMSLTKAITWLHQKQRYILEKESVKFAIAEPSDFLVALEIFSSFFDLTYSGIDHRSQKILELIKNGEGKFVEELEKEYPNHKTWIPRHQIQKTIGLSINTVKNSIKQLKNQGYIESYYEKGKKAYLLQTVKDTINSPSLPISIGVIDSVLTEWLIVNKQQFYYNKSIIPIDYNYFTSEDSPNIPNFDSVNLTLSKFQNTHSESPKVIEEYIDNEHDSFDLLKELQKPERIKDPLPIADIPELSGWSLDETQRKIQYFKDMGEVYEIRPGHLSLLR